MLQFLKYVFATIVGLLLFTIIGFFLLAGIGAAIGSSSDAVSLKDNSVLKLDLNRPIVENVSDDAFTKTDLANTIRARFAYRTASHNDWSALIISPGA